MRLELCFWNRLSCSAWMCKLRGKERLLNAILSTSGGTVTAVQDEGVRLDSFQEDVY